MFCKNCGKELQENWSACTACGTKIGISEAIATSLPTQTRKTNVALVGCLGLGGSAFVLIAIIAIIGSSLPDRSSSPRPSVKAETNAPPPSVEEARSRGTAKATSPSLHTPWYSGGTLHRATALEWRTATPDNRLATSADIAVIALEQAGQKLSSMDQLLPRAVAVETCVSEAAKSPTPGTTEVSTLAAMCVILLDQRLGSQ